MQSIWPLLLLLTLPSASAAILYVLCGYLCTAISKAFPESVAFRLHWVGTLTHELTHAVGGLPFGIIPTGLTLQQVPGRIGVQGTLQIRYQRNLFSYIGLAVAGSAPLIMTMLTPALLFPNAHSTLYDWLQTGDIASSKEFTKVIPAVVGFGVFGFPFLAYARLSLSDIKACAPVFAFVCLISLMGYNLYPEGLQQLEGNLDFILRYAIANFIISVLAILFSWISLSMVGLLLRHP